MKFTAYLIVPIFLASLSSGRAAEVSGIVYLKGTRDPLPGVSVFHPATHQKSITGKKGEFEFKDLSAGEQELVVNAPGYERTQDKFSLEKNETRSFKIILNRLNEINFETTIEDSIKKDGAEKKISKKLAASLPGSGADPIRAVQNMPGVNRGLGFSSQVIIQGSAPQDTRYTIDQHEIPLIFHFGGLSSVFSPDLTESYDYLSAGYRTQYGRALGGLINLNSRDVNADHFKGSLFVDTFNSGATLEVPVGEASHLSLAGRVSYIGQVLNALAKNSDGFKFTVAPAYSDISLVYVSPLSSQLKFKMLVIGSKDSLEFVSKKPLGGDTSLRGGFSNKINFYRLIPQFVWTHSAHSQTRFSLGIGHDELYTNFGDQYLDLKIWSATLRAENTTRVSPSFTLVYGLDERLGIADVRFRLPVLYDEGGVFNPLGSADTKIAELKGLSSNQYGAYLNPIFIPQPGSPFTFYPGLRFDYFQIIKDSVVEPRASMRYALQPDLSLIAASGLYAQAPQNFETSPVYGNQNLKSEKAWHLKIGAEKDLSGQVSRGSEYDLGIFGRWFRDLVIPDVKTTFSNQGSGKAFGLENSLKLNFDPWDFWVSYTLSRSTREDPKHSSYLYQYDQTHFLTLIAGRNLPKNWRISSRFRYVSGARSTPILGATEDVDHNIYIPVRGPLFGEQLEAFSMLDLRVDKKWVYDTWTLSLYLDIQNFLNHKNSEGVQYSYDYKTKDTVDGLPILPTFGLKGEF